MKIITIIVAIVILCVCCICTVSGISSVSRLFNPQPSTEQFGPDFTVEETPLPTSTPTPLPTPTPTPSPVTVELIGEASYQLDKGTWEIDRMDEVFISRFGLRVKLVSESLYGFTKKEVCLGWPSSCPGRAEFEISTELGTNRKLLQLTGGEKVAYWDDNTQYQISALTTVINYEYSLGFPYKQDIVVKLYIERVP